jgi:hypothetical protein
MFAGENFKERARTYLRSIGLLQKWIIKKLFLF